MQKLPYREVSPNGEIAMTLRRPSLDADAFEVTAVDARTNTPRIVERDLPARHYTAAVFDTDNRIWIYSGDTGITVHTWDGQMWRRTVWTTTSPTPLPDRLKDFVPRSLGGRR